MVITPESTIETLIVAARAERAARRAARFAKQMAGAKTNEDVLIAQGVIVTEDTALDNAMRYQREMEESARRGVSVEVIRAEWDTEELRSTVLTELRHAVQLGETPTEHHARRAAILTATVGHRDSGRRCDHARTKTSPGWMNKYGAYNMEFPDHTLKGWSFRCTKCKADVNVQPVAAPTEQAQLAAKLLQAETQA